MVQRVDASWGAESARVAALSAAVTDRVERILPVAMLPRMLLFSEEFQVTIKWKCRGGESAARTCQCVFVCLYVYMRSRTGSGTACGLLQRDCTTGHISPAIHTYESAKFFGKILLQSMQ
jgi:hypothetical protein